MDGMGAEQLPLPAEQPEADDEIDIEGDDDVPLLHHEALQHEACLCRINLSLAFTQAVPQAASACSPMIEQCLAVDQHLTLAQELVQEPAEEPSEHTAATVEDELDPAGPGAVPRRAVPRGVRGGARGGRRGRGGGGCR